MIIRPNKQTIDMGWQLNPVAQRMWICIVDVILKIIVTPILFVSYKVCVAVEMPVKEKVNVFTTEACLKTEHLLTLANLPEEHIFFAFYKTYFNVILFVSAVEKVLWKLSIGVLSKGLSSSS